MKTQASRGLARLRHGLDAAAALGGVEDVISQLPNEDGVGAAQEVLIDRCSTARVLDLERGPVSVDAADLWPRR